MISLPQVLWIEAPHRKCHKAPGKSPETKLKLDNEEFNLIREREKEAQEGEKRGENKQIV